MQTNNKIIQKDTRNYFVNEKTTEVLSNFQVKYKEITGMKCTKSDALKLIVQHGNEATIEVVKVKYANLL
jgi:hypothetical protein